MLLLIPHGITANIYIRELGRAYTELGWDVIYHADNFFECSAVPEFLHLHWPEEQYRWQGDGPIEARAKRFIEQLSRYKSQGSKLVWTVHNIAPHEHKENPIDLAAYQAVIDHADLIVHHCENSVSLLAKKYVVSKETHQIVIPHGHFMGYPKGISAQAARSKLGLPADALVFLQFGQVRAYKGLDLMLSAFSKLKLKNKHLMIAGRYSCPPGRNRLLDKLSINIKEKFTRRSTFHLQEVPSNDVQIYMAAANALVLTHTSGLNSGVAILGMSFDKTIIAPDIGCISQVVPRDGNYLYEAGNELALIQAMENFASGTAQPSSQVSNLSVASNWSWHAMAATVLRSVRAS